jgi:hypothetical protein
MLPAGSSHCEVAAVAGVCERTIERVMEHVRDQAQNSREHAAE